MIYITIIFGVIVLALVGILAYKPGWLSVLHRRIVGWSVVFYGVFLATLTGNYTSFYLPGIGSIAIGAGAGAAVGFITWVVIGTVGVATGGIGVAIGAGAMALIGAMFGSAGGAAGGIGIHTVSYPLISPFFWVPVVILGIYFLCGKKIKMQQVLPPK